MLADVRIKTYKAGSAVIVQNAPNPGFFYIVRKGALAIDTEHRLSEKVLSRFEPGDSFGLVSALTGHHFLVTIQFTRTPRQRLPKCRFPRSANISGLIPSLP